MNGVHDMGGMQGFGAIPIEDSEPVFHADWERRVFGLDLAMGAQLGASGDAWRHAIERMRPSDYLSAQYYERWLHVLVELSVGEGLISRDELEQRCRDLAEKEKTCRS